MALADRGKGDEGLGEADADADADADLLSGLADRGTAGGAA